MSCKGNCKCKCNRAIITGINGQDGSHLADLLLEKNYKVVGVVRRSSTNSLERIRHLVNHPNLKIVEGDVTDIASIVNVLQKFPNTTEFYNLAAQSHVSTSFKQPGLTWDITGKGCMNVVQAIVDMGLNHIRFYQASSSEMFGSSYDVDRNGKKFQNEYTKLSPQSPYAVAKCAAHQLVRIYREAYGLHASSGILFNHEGPRRGEQFVTRKITKWIGDFVRSDYDPSFPRLRLGNLNAYRDWGYAGDYVEAMWKMLQQPIADDYVICTGETHTIKDFLQLAFRHIGIKDWFNYVIEDPEFYRPLEVDYLNGDNTKAQRILGWKPRTSFEELVKIMVNNDIEKL